MGIATIAVATSRKTTRRPMKGSFFDVTSVRAPRLKFQPDATTHRDAGNLPQVHCTFVSNTLATFCLLGVGVLQLNGIHVPGSISLVFASRNQVDEVGRDVGPRPNVTWLQTPRAVLFILNFQLSAMSLPK